MKYPLLISYLSLLVACAPAKTVTCDAAGSDEVISVDTKQFSRYWSVDEAVEPAFVTPEVEAMIRGGRHGFVVLEQTLNRAGQVTDIAVIDSHPDDVFVATAIAQAQKTSYSPLSCPPVAVRYRVILRYTNGENVYQINRQLAERGHTR